MPTASATWTQGHKNTGKAAKPDNLRLVFGTHIVEGENQFLQAELWQSHACHDMCVYVYAHTQMNECDEK